MASFVQRDAFDGAFFRLLGSFSGLKPSAKAEELRRAMQSLKPARLALWESFLETAVPSHDVAQPGKEKEVWAVLCVCVC